MYLGTGVYSSMGARPLARGRDYHDSHLHAEGEPLVVLFVSFPDLHAWQL
jgi:hypothetical protein